MHLKVVGSIPQKPGSQGDAVDSASPQADIYEKNVSQWKTDFSSPINKSKIKYA